MRAALSTFAASALLLSAVAADAQTKTWTSQTDFAAGALAKTSATTTPGAVVLGPTPVSQNHTVWSTNYLYGYTVRLDTLTGKQTGRYDSSLTTINGTPTGAPPANEYCNFSTTGNCPGRVAVDANGDVWIVNRAFGKQGTVTKFSGDLSRCIDKNGNGVIDTSFDANGDGQISVVAGAGEYFGQNDECILTTFAVGPVNVYPRGVAIDKKGKVWVSTHNDGKLYRYNPNEPVSLEATVTVGGNPYSLATGGDYVFISSSSGATRRVHIDTLAIQSVPCPGTYGVVADPSGNVAWLGGYFTGNGIYKADFVAGTCPFTNLPSSITAITLDRNNNVWAAGYSSNTVFKLNSAGVLLGTYPAGGTNPHGLSVDFDGFLWVVNHGPTPNMTKIATATGALVGTYPIGGPGVPNADPYLYSDFTGLQIDRQAPYSRLGTWSATYDGGAASIPWSRLAWNAESAGAVPSLTSLTLQIRAADTTDALAAAAYVPATNGAALAGVTGRYVQVQASLSGPGYVTPTVSDVTVTGPCGGATGESCCVTAADCADTNTCTIDTCPVPGGACVHTKSTSCCLVTADCDDGDLCTDDTCPTAGGACSNTRRTGCCMSNADCADSDPCTVDVCSGPGGTCSHPTIAGCCNTDTDCTLASVCTTSTCPGPGRLCVTTPKPGCCKTDKDCADTDLCTEDKCDVATGVCSNRAVTGCCKVDGDCNDGKACTRDTCSTAGGVCVASVIAGCCNADADCNDGNVCTTDSCSGAGGTCVHSAKAGCCAVAGDCDDGDACTDDLCPTAGGACEHKKKESCCRSNAECDDGNKCTTDTCAAGKGCAHDKIAGCCNSNTDCPVGECVSGTCAPPADAGVTTPDTSGTLEGGGCGCETAGHASSNALLLVGLVATLGAVARRRRR